MKTADSTAPEEFGPYIVYERLGVGGMATVHRAKKRGIAGYERGVALKRMLPHLAEDAEFINSFVREAKLASLLVHPNIAQIYDFGRVGAVYYIAMEHVDGFDVRKMLRYSNRHKEPLPLHVVMSILCELCEALEYAHTFVDEHGTPQGIVHRDVSPSNLIVAQSGHLKVIDFGIAKANVRQLHTESGRVKGKLGYMSPEAVSGRAFGPVSDVFSAGVVAHELLTAHPLFSAKTDYDTLIRIHEAEILPPSRRNPGVPASLDEVVLAALSRDPERRLQTAGAFREALEYVAEQSGIRFSARDVAEWRAKIATTEDPWGSRTSLPNVSSSSVSRAFPDSRNSLSGTPPRPQTYTGQPRTPHEQRLAPSGLASLSDTPGEVDDDDKSVADLTWGLDPAQAQIHPIPDLGVSPEPAAAPAVRVGSQPARKTGVARLTLVALFAVAAGLAVYQFVLRHPAPPAPQPPPPPPALATVKFSIQPSDAIVEIGGKEVGHSSPFETRLEPGVYSVSVHRRGYKPRSSELTLRGAESQTVNFALEQGMAFLTVTSQPVGLIVRLDGNPLAQPTPLEVQVPAGPHQLVVTNAAGLEWTQDLTAEIDRKYPFVATFAKRAPVSTPAVGAGRVSTPPPPPPSAPDRNRRTAAPSRPGKDSDAEVRITDNSSETEVPAGPKQPAKPLDAGVPMVVPPDAATVTAPAVATGPKVVPIVSPNNVTKLSGAIPTMKVEGVTDKFADVQSKVCIDERGNVTKVKVIKALAEISDELQRILGTWRYQPYTNSAGQPSAVCFPVSFRVVFKRAN